LAFGSNVNMESMKLRCAAVMPRDETMRVLDLLIHSGSSCE